MKFACTVPLAAIALAQPAPAQMPQLEPGRYHCTATDDHWSIDQDIVPLKLGQEMRLAFRLIGEDANAKRPARAAVHLKTPAGFPRIARGRSVRDPLQMFVVLDVPGTPQQLLYEFPLTKQWIILKLRLDDRGFLTVRNSDLAPKFPLGSREVSRTMLQCNGGEWDIDVWPRSYVP